MAPARQAPVPGRRVARVNGTAPRLSVAPGRKGFKAELEELRERMGGLGLGHGQIAGEIARRYRLRPREAFRLAHGWTLGQAAAQFNARAAGLGTDPGGQASLAANRLCEYEKWPHSERRPSVYVLVMLAQVYQAGVLDLLDLADHEHLPPRDRLTLLQPGQPAPSEPGLSTLAGTAPDTGQAGGLPPGLVPGPPVATGQGMSLSLPYVPGRLVIEVTDPAPSTGQRGGQTAQAVTGLVVQTPGPAALAPAPSATAGTPNPGAHR
jgi:transcriptional regulator with XRE-family HTH domain